MFRLCYFKLIFLFTILSLNCNISKNNNSASNNQLFNPPNCVKINDSLYVDRTEVDNLNYREYMYYTSKVFGLYSKEFIASIPDTLVWSKEDSCLQRLDSTYLFYSRYERFPVVGVSQTQARNYSEWRSNAVFEMLLIKKGVIKTNPNLNSNTRFTIQKFINGKYPTIKEYYDIKYYPEFSLPTINERIIIHKHIKSIESNGKVKKKAQACQSCWFENCVMNLPFEPCNDNLEYELMNRISHPLCFDRNKKRINNLNYGIAEWLAEDSIIAGGSWINKKEHDISDDTTRISQVKAWVGFRNVCKWRKWKD